MKKPERRVHGMNIYLDQYGNYVYYNVFNKKVYVIEPEDEARFLIMKDRYIFALIVYVLFSGFESTSNFSLPILLVFVALFEAYFRFIYLKKLRCYTDHKLVKRVWYEPSKNDGAKQGIVAVLYVVFAGLLMANAIVEKYDTTQIVVTGIIVLLVVFRLVMIIIGLIKKNKEK